MKRYFEVVGKRQVMLFDIVDESAAATASITEFEVYVGEKLREISRQKHTALKKIYTGCES